MFIGKPVGWATRLHTKVTPQSPVRHLLQTAALDFAYCRFLTKIPYTLFPGRERRGYCCREGEIATSYGTAGV